MIEKAEQRWREKETIKLVRSEYEVLGADGEREVVKKGGGRKEKAGGGNSAAVKDVVVSPGGLDDDEDYELV